MSEHLWPWVVLAILGAYHGINPGMGWLFAVALGLQEGRRSAVLRALPAIAVGHEASVGLVILLVSGLELVTAPDVLRVGGAVALIAFGVYKFLRPRSHPKWVGMRVGVRDLGIWSFLMSTAHGAGLMLFPVLLTLDVEQHVDPGRAHQAIEGSLSLATAGQDVAALIIHTGAMLLVMAAVALLVYEKLGVSVLRRAWLNLDILWAGAVIAAGIFTLVT
jgi:hypothetical protein